jgi:hypothetical protein
LLPTYRELLVLLVVVVLLLQDCNQGIDWPF